ncbi:uncharacterized protein LOC110962357 isoform X2 [Acanthochromis polyacanthus]|uniref:uncharacterized protein LOC110962357 isoform X2 n=1 Tax=Acanthochromis polyacanthus TaxID=80966 RepID=UPI0022340CF7|nr:uncharacterized protein LOC110962357 isoform X2 [Acanthochromis polyacanthus]
MYSEGRVTLEEQENSDHKEEKAMLDTLSWSPRAAGGAADLPVLQVTTGAVCAQSVLTTAACLIHPRVVFCPRRSQAAALWFWEMGRSQMLRQLVTERLCSAAEEICSLLEQTAEEHQAEGVQYRTQIIQEVQEVQELSVSKPRVVILPPDPQLVVQKVLPLQKTEQTELQNETPVLLPIEEEPKTQKTQQTQTASDFKVPPEVPGCRSPGFWEMGRSQMLRKLVTERLCSAAEEICGLLEQTVEEHQAEGVQYRRQIIQLRQQVQELSVSNPRVVILPPAPVLAPTPVFPAAPVAPAPTASVSVSRFTRRNRRRRAEEEASGAHRRKYVRKVAFNKCTKCGQPKTKEFGHSRFGSATFCPSFSGGKSLEEWLAEQKQKPGNPPPHL